MMVDIEALGTSHNGLITQIGACYFDWYGNIAATFLVNINLKSAVARGMEMDIGAVCFWLEQAAQQGLPSWLKETVPLAKGLNDFYEDFTICINVSVQFDFSFFVNDADVHFFCVQVDSAIKFVLFGVKSHGLPPLVCVNGL